MSSIPKAETHGHPPGELGLSEARIEELRRIQAEPTHLNAGLFFSDPSLKIPKILLEALTIDMRFEKPSQIQAETIPRIILGKDLIAQAQSGAGKTVAFVVGMLSRVDPSRRVAQGLILTPTRELANQIVHDAVMPLSRRIEGIRIASAIPGNDPVRGEECDCQIIVGTPGTLKKWISVQYLKPKSINIFVVDEADTMVGNSQKSRSLGAETIFIKKQLRDDCQQLLFSATFSEEVMTFAKTILKPGVIVIRPPSVEDLMLDVIFQVRMDVRKHRGGKLGILKDIYDFMTIEQSIVFVERKIEANEVAASLTQAGLEVSLLHGDLDKDVRDKVMEDFRRGDSKVLITTNVLARGVDVPSVAVVVNYDIPLERDEGILQPDYASYLHRIGRCGRFGRLGTAINFINNDQDERALVQIEKYYRPKQRMTTDWDPNDIEGLKEAISHRGTHDESHEAKAVEPTENFSNIESQASEKEDATENSQES